MHTTASAGAAELREPRPLRALRIAWKTARRPKAGGWARRPQWTPAERAVGLPVGVRSERYGSGPLAGGGSGGPRVRASSGAWEPVRDRALWPPPRFLSWLLSFWPAGPLLWCCTCAGCGAPGAEPQDSNLYHEHSPFTTQCPHRVQVTPKHSLRTPGKCSGPPGAPCCLQAQTQTWGCLSFLSLTAALR